MAEPVGFMLLGLRASTKQECCDGKTENLFHVSPSQIALSPCNFPRDWRQFTISGRDRLRSYKLYHLWRQPMRVRTRVIWFLLMPAILVSLAQARVVRVEITSRGDIQEGKPFGNVGAYE